MRFDIVNVFAEGPFGGNPLAVVHEASGLSTADMQRIAAQFNLSETTFVTGRTASAATVRIFTPAEELPFAGHPSVGTAWVLSEGRGGIDLDLPIGRVSTSTDAAAMLWVDTPAPDLGEPADAALAAAMVGLQPGDLHAGLPPQGVSLGLRFLLLPLGDEEVLARARLDGQRHEALLAAGYPWDAVLLFVQRAPGTDADYAARMFFRAPDVREDPATGSANLCLAAYLQAHLGADQAFTVAQGDQMGRPSRLGLRTQGQRFSLGGHVQRFAHGTLQP